MMKKITYPLLIFLLWQPLIAPAQTITLEECLDAAEKYFPLFKKNEYIRENTIWLNRNLENKFLPEVGIYGQATYQSETTHFPGAVGPAFPEISKDQYRIFSEVNQIIFDGGTARVLKEVNIAGEAVQLQQNAVGFQNVKEKIVELYFSVLLQEARTAQQKLLQENLLQALKKGEAALQNRTITKSSVNEIKAEIINQQMQQADIKWARAASIEMLAILTGLQIDTLARFITPGLPAFADSLSRQELILYELQKKSLLAQQKKLRTDWIPRLSAFLQAGGGRPGLNMLDNRLKPFAIGGIRFQLPLGSLYNYRNNASILSNQQKMLSAEESLFRMNINTAMQKQKFEVARYENLMAYDLQAVALRKEVTAAAKAQLEHGIITTHEFIQKLNAENLANQMLEFHKIQRLQALYNLKTISGY